MAERVPGARLLIVGNRPYRSALGLFARELGLDESVKFAGYVEDHRVVEELIATSAVGLAVYDPSMASFTEFAEPGKIKNSLAAGVPVITTRVVHTASRAEEFGAGIVVDYDAAAVADALTRLLADPERQRAMRSAAAALGKEADWTLVFDRAFAGLGF